MKEKTVYSNFLMICLSISLRRGAFNLSFSSPLLPEVMKHKKPSTNSLSQQFDSP